MNNDIKVSLSIKLQGSTLVRRETTHTVEKFNKKTNKKYTKTYKTYVLEPKEAILSKNLTKDCYDFFVSEASCPHLYMRKDWKKMSKEQRLQYNLKELCKAYHGLNYTYFVYED